MSIENNICQAIDIIVEKSEISASIADTTLKQSETNKTFALQLEQIAHKFIVD